MPNITSYEIFDEEVKKIGLKPRVLEALWCGDTNGWFLLLYVTTQSGWLFKTKKRHLIGDITLSNDIRLFTNEVPPWPESVLAKEIGATAVAKYRLIFYMPSEEPDEDCPSWADRHKGISCADCGKLIIPTTGPYLPKDICYSCHLKREFSENLKNGG
jgi:hypothetical protein